MEKYVFDGGRCCYFIYDVSSKNLLLLNNASTDINQGVRYVYTWKKRFKGEKWRTRSENLTVKGTWYVLGGEHIQMKQSKGTKCMYIFLKTFYCILLDITKYLFKRKWKLFNIYLCPKFPGCFVAK